ncbi:hypothetical protein ABPG72_018475 [Tetrahymena utriculariae]
MKIYRIYTKLVRLFQYHHVDEPHYSAINILQKSLNIPYSQVDTNQTMFSSCFSHYYLNQIQRMYFKRRAMMPIQYVIGEWEFRDVKLKMKPPVLIPRNETSYLVELVNKLSKQKQKCQFLEIGIGTGAISLSLLKENNQFTGVAIDKQPFCIKLARQNLNLNKIDSQRLQLIHIECLQFFQNIVNQNPTQQFDFMVSNPPYIPTNMVNNLDKQVRKFEDKVALDGGSDGLDIVKQILDYGYQVLKEEGFLALEVDVTHNTLLEQYFENNTYGWKDKYKKAQFFKDQYERDRFCVFFK